MHVVSTGTGPISVEPACPIFYRFTSLFAKGGRKKCWVHFVRAPYYIVGIQIYFN